MTRTATPELATYDDERVQSCTDGGVGHDWRPHTARSQFGPYERTYWRCVWCHGVTCGDYDEADPCWLPYHHRTDHRSRAGEVWPLGGERPSDLARYVA
jgi:hypothetical protein